MKQYAIIHALNLTKRINIGYIMRNKLITVLSSVSLCVLSMAAHASGFYSSGSQSSQLSGYYSSMNSSHDGYYSSIDRPQSQHFSVAMNIPAYMGYRANQNDQYIVYARARKHAYRQLLWVNAATGSPVPSHTLIGGEQPGTKQVLYICRANYLGGMHPGKLQKGKCTFTYHGNEIRTNHYQLLVSNKPARWSPASFGKIPPHSILGGNDSGKPLYICQANYQDGRLPGKVIGEDCHIGYEGRVIAIPHYQVLVS